MRYFYFYSALVLFLIFSSFSLSFAVTLEMSESDKSKLPEGPSPATYPTNKTTGYAPNPNIDVRPLLFFSAACWQAPLVKKVSSVQNDYHVRAKTLKS